MGVLMTVAMPVWRHDAQREKEAELIFRAGQVVHAIDMYKKRFANQYPPSLDVLVQQKYLRKKYKDPMTKDGEWRILTPQELAGTPLAPGGRPLSGQPGGGPGTGPSGRGPLGSSGSQSSTGSGSSPSSSSSSPFLQDENQNTSGMGAPRGTQYAGPIAGVASRSKEHSIRIFKGRDRYDQWIVTIDDVRPRTLVPQQPGQQQQPGGTGLSPSPSGLSSSPTGSSSSGLGRTP
jgi:type II secretory pathway pseudopilin PulG